MSSSVVRVELNFFATNMSAFYILTISDLMMMRFSNMLVNSYALDH